MQIVSPTYTAPKAKQKRSKKAKAETPEKYRGRYTHMGRKLGGTSYWVRAKDPGAVYAKSMAECVDFNRKRVSPGDNVRAIIYSEDNGGSVYHRPTFGAQWQTTAWCEGVPAGSSESDLEELETLSKREKHANTLNTFSKRIRMLLGTMFDVQEVEGTGSVYLRSETITLNCNGNMVYIVPKKED